ncbi:MAG: peptidylprolyl isomerase [Sedimenticola sp.]|uniref:Peptidyl-prolyl cis-trans isomerase n=1 Tax=Sedimenticola thiotaurini TaxID=1543721 RepID=A0A558DC65_9GAMM|nr:peptidylprolyl isomerase [Sedimenticola sp.]MCW8975336.1 peptidylprolyl isomerase [Sedimenticola sp.]MCW9021974.1 peptidylprolyl isomerase [Sedimenticola sp.]TVT58622.1 MAG: peptidylprolyl isomerase [Sedimenticola thiotaurini]
MQITDFKAVILDYVTRDQSGEIIDSSANDGYLTYIHGTESLIPALEEALSGHQQGEKLSISISCDDAYGERDESLIESVPRENFPGVEQIEVGMQFQTEMEEGVPFMVTVVDLDDESVTVDGNHPLAGKVLNFDLEIIEVRDASSDEIEHGHVHHDGAPCQTH